MKRGRVLEVAAGLVSLPTRERELKLGVLQNLASEQVSLPTRERELKRASRSAAAVGSRVAPYTGA